MSYPINSIQDFFQWAKTRDPEETYDYYSRTDCAIARYCKARGVRYAINDRNYLHGLYGKSNLERFALFGCKDGEYASKCTMGQLVAVLEREINKS